MAFPAFIIEKADCFRLYGVGITGSRFIERYFFIHRLYAAFKGDHIA